MIMIKRTSSFFATKTSLVVFLTFLGLIKPRMILDLFPAMHFWTSKPISTSIFIIHQKLISFPVRTFFQLLFPEVRFPPEILPIVTILTLRSVMFELVERTKHCFKVEHVEVLIFFQSMDQRHTKFSNRMCKWTVNSILAFIDFVRILFTELGFILGFSIQHFHIVVTELTIFSF